MNFKAGDQVVVIKPTEGLPAFKVSGKIYTVEMVDEYKSGYQMLKLEGVKGSWNDVRFEKYETKLI